MRWKAAATPSPKPTTRVNFAGIVPTLDVAAAAAGDISTMLNTVASVTAVNESVASQPATFTDSTLVNLVAESLNFTKRAQVYVPNVVPPNADGMNLPLLKQTFLFNALQNLGANRTALELAADRLLTPSCRNDSKNPNVPAATKLAVGGLVAASQSASGLFGGFALPPTGLIAASEAKPAANSKASPAPGKPNGSTTINITTAAAPPQAAQGPPAVQRLLYIDLLLHQLGAADSAFPGDTYLLAVHALEAGSSQLVKTQIFSGARTYYSGGAVATFTLVDSAGSIACSGVTYGYRGFIRADDISHAIPTVGSGEPVRVPGTDDALPNTAAYLPACPVR